MGWEDEIDLKNFDYKLDKNESKSFKLENVENFTEYFFKLVGNH